MRWLIPLAALGIIGLAAWVWLSGGDRVVAAWALEGQRSAQEAMAGALRRLRAGDPAAVGGLMAICFGYGFFHAAGPGHGKLLIGGYGAAREVGALRLSLVALASSLSQGLTAVLLVGLGLWAFGWGREQMTDWADRLFAPLSFAAIALVGLWLCVRGLRGLLRLRAAQSTQHHHHDHDHSGDGAVCSTCGHAHAPDADALARASGPREVVALIAAVAVRPCTGALFLLILTAQVGVFWAGVAGTFAMALGTASVTIAVALAAVGLRRGLLSGLTESATLARAQPIMELVIGAVIALLATQLAIAAL